MRDGTDVQVDLKKGEFRFNNGDLVVFATDSEPRYRYKIIDWESYLFALLYKINNKRYATIILKKRLSFLTQSKSQLDLKSYYEFDGFDNWIKKFNHIINFLIGYQPKKFKIKQLIKDIVEDKDYPKIVIMEEIYCFPDSQRLVKVEFKKEIPLYGMQSPLDDLQSNDKIEAVNLMSFLMFNKGIKCFICLQENDYERIIWETLKRIHPFYNSDVSVKYIEHIIHDYQPMNLNVASKLLNLLNENLLKLLNKSKFKRIKRQNRYIPTLIHCGAGCGRTGSVMFLLRLYLEFLNKRNIFEHIETDEMWNLLNNFYRYNSASGKASLVVSENYKNKIDQKSPAIEFFNQEGKGRINLLRINMNTIKLAILKFVKKNNYLPEEIKEVTFYKKTIKLKDTLEEIDKEKISTDNLLDDNFIKDKMFKHYYFSSKSY